jgi:hypothetical protein
MKIKALTGFVATLILLLVSLPSWALIPFTAVYQLNSQYALAPSVSITHEFRRNGSGYQTQMEAGVSLASWREHSLFFLNAEALPVSRDFRTRTRVVQNRSDRRLSFEGRADTTYDRQTVVFLLPEIALREGPGTSGRLDVLNHRGRERNIEYFVHEITQFQSIKAAVIDVWFEEKADEMLGRIHFSLDVPGLILQAEAFDDKGASLGVLKLTRWSPI